VRSVSKPVTLTILSIDVAATGFRARATTRIDHYDFGLTRGKGMGGRFLQVDVSVLAQPHPAPAIGSPHGQHFESLGDEAMSAYLNPIEKPRGLMLKMVYWLSRRQVGKVIAPIKISYAHGFRQLLCEAAEAGQEAPAPGANSRADP
jgi:hypothetical protein